MIKDFTPTKETISLHGSGFLQLILPNSRRIHIWHPDLPRRKCFEHSAIHNHRFNFTSQVLKGVQRNVRVDLELVKEGEGSHVVISHNGPRGLGGGRLSYPVAECNVYPRISEEYLPGDGYYMPKYEYHHTPCEGIVMTLMHKYGEDVIHATSVCKKGVEYHHGFDRQQMSIDDMYDIVLEAIKFESPYQQNLDKESL